MAENDAGVAGAGHGPGGRTPDQFVKRAPTVSSTAALGSGGSALGLLALYINQCLTADDWVVPSAEMIIVVLGLVLPAVHLVWNVGAARLKAWAKSQGVET